jgi:hypothetical protein
MIQITFVSVDGRVLLVDPGATPPCPYKALWVWNSPTVPSDRSRVLRDGVWYETGRVIWLGPQKAVVMVSEYEDPGKYEEFVVTLA